MQSFRIASGLALIMTLLTGLPLASHAEGYHSPRVELGSRQSHWSHPPQWGEGSTRYSRPRYTPPYQYNPPAWYGQDNQLRPVHGRHYREPVRPIGPHHAPPYHRGHPHHRHHGHGYHKGHGHHRGHHHRHHRPKPHHHHRHHASRCAWVAHPYRPHYRVRQCW